MDLARTSCLILKETTDVLNDCAATQLYSATTCEDETGKVDALAVAHYLINLILPPSNHVNFLKVINEWRVHYSMELFVAVTS